ncbi:DUF3307 domain-containing protein [Flagellimonas myxillae]|uniref:DUF3307 domain-containing protein n=1 Tax=Flagellimonas myxillae TaxID=2942214 RepID=UPI00201E77F1|nr:DUF3307 domain-containing protein [Muricauda myxillae]MCL6268078.1 DUF3307 domain-containing protein [Muricauda myxillae]
MTFALILVAHWVGDYVFQTSRMAMEKSSKLKWLSLHVLMYMVTLGVFSAFLFPAKQAVTYVVANGLLHFVTDFFTSRLASKYQDNPRIFYPVLGFDQLIHGLCLYLTFINLENLI